MYVTLGAFGNLTDLPGPLRPRKAVIALTGLAAVFYLGFAVYYVLSELGVIGGAGS